MLLPADLPDDLHALCALLVERDLQITALEEAKALADAELARLGAIIAALQQRRFGTHSEQLHPDQLLLALEEVDATNGLEQAGLTRSWPSSRRHGPATRTGERCLLSRSRSISWSTSSTRRLLRRRTPHH